MLMTVLILHVCCCIDYFCYFVICYLLFPCSLFPEANLLWVHMEIKINFGPLFDMKVSSVPLQSKFLWLVGLFKGHRVVGTMTKL